MAESPRTPVPVALIGLGKMGRFHYKTIRGDPRFELLAVVDPQVAELPEGDAGPELLSNVSGLRQRFPQLAAAVVAAPTSLHYDLTRQLLEQDIAVLVEKPAATNGAAARELVDLAERRGVPLAAGHVERCNPAVSALQTVLGCGILGRPVHVHAMRGGPWPPGASHNHVILDLAVHELDVLALLLGPLELEHGALHTLADTPDRPHTAEIQVKSPAGVTASVHANWLTPQKTRQMRVTGTGGVGIIDYAAQTCHLWGKDLREKESLLRLPFRRERMHRLRGTKHQML